MADTFTSGTAGRVRVGADVTVAGITKWSRQTTFGTIRIPHFESTADGDGIIHPNHLKGIAGAHTISLEGYFNSDATNKTDGSTIGFKVGNSLSIDLLITRTPLGFINLTATVTNMNIEVAVENQPARFTCQCEIDGDPEISAAA